MKTFLLSFIDYPVYSLASKANKSFLEKAVIEIVPNPNSRFLANQTIYEPNTMSVTNFCALQTQVENGQLQKKNALVGLDLSVGVLEDDVERNKGGVFQKNTYVSFTVFDELSKRAKFTWKNSHEIFDAPKQGETYTDILTDGLQKNDVMVDWFSQIPDRVDKYINFAYPFFDASVIMIQKEANDQYNISLISIFKPFKKEV